MPEREGDGSSRIRMRQRSKGFDLRIGSLNRMYCATERRPGVTFRILRELLITAPCRHCQYPRFNRADVVRDLGNAALTVAFGVVMVGGGKCFIFYFFENCLPSRCVGFSGCQVKGTRGGAILGIFVFKGVIWIFEASRGGGFNNNVHSQSVIKVYVH